MKHHLLHLFLLFILSQFHCFNGCLDTERAALLNFKSSLSDPSARLSSWKGQNCCNWHGIECSESSHVVSVDLRNPNPDLFVRGLNSKLLPVSDSKTTAFNGTISPSLFTLRGLRYLDLSFNNFHFSKIPHQLANLGSLSYLNLSNSMFSGSITTQLRNLSSLQSLDLSCSVLNLDFSSISFNLSSLEGSIDSTLEYFPNGNISSANLNWLQDLVNLRELRLEGVDLSAVSALTNWAEPISLLSDLRLLHLSDCGISGPIPINQLLNLQRLYSLEMGFNFLASRIPVELANLTSLSSLDLTRSHLKGSIPYLPRLQRLYVSGNPDLMVDLTWMFMFPWANLQILSIQSINVVGSIPPSISNATSLVELAAAGSSIHGLIPTSISDLPNLRYLDLSFNNITGYLPDSISDLKNLELLYLFQNNLGGPIPESICEISSLQHFHIGNNNFSGKIPNCIGQLPKLETFFVGANSMDDTVSLASLFRNSTPTAIGLSFSGLTVKVDHAPFLSNFQPEILGLASCNLGGEIPGFISNITQITFLDLSYNNLTGEIPYWLFNLPKLSVLILSYNHLQGFLPPSLQLHLYFPFQALDLSNNNLEGRLPLLMENIEVLNLSWNNFTGEIPTRIGETLSDATSISLAGNNLTGPIPQSLCQHNNVFLKTLDLANNHLSGPIPSSLGNCISLISLNLGTNNFVGNLPSELKSAKNISSLQLNDNHFNGPFPSSIRNFENLEFLNLMNNNFEGDIPAFIGELLNLRLLILKSNSFNMSIPNEIAHLPKLQFMDLSNNKLSGPVPDELGGLKTLIQPSEAGLTLGYVISLAYVDVEFEIATKGSVHRIPSILTYVSGIDLSNNFLVGNIPRGIGTLKGLYMLNMSHNSFSGPIPTSFGNMSSLESLDLSFNSLTGEIPVSLTLLDFLQILNLSYNELRGEIPQGAHFDTLSGEGGAYIGNSLLCGAPVGKKCADDEMGGGDDNDDDDDDDMGDEDVGDDDERRKWLIFGAFMFLGFVVGFWGLFGVLGIREENWWDAYWRHVDDVAMRIIQWVSKMG